MIKTISISGMSCINCSNAVTNALKEVAGVTDVQVSLENKNAVVTGENLNDKELSEAVEGIGFDVNGIA